MVESDEYKKTFPLPLLVMLAIMGNAPAQQRNVLLIIADDLGTDSLGLYNNSPGAALPPTPASIPTGRRGQGVKPGGMCLRSRKWTTVLDTGASSCVHTARADWQGLEQGASPISSKTKHPMGYP